MKTLYGTKIYMFYIAVIMLKAGALQRRFTVLKHHAVQKQSVTHCIGSEENKKADIHLQIWVEKQFYTRTSGILWGHSNALWCQLPYPSSIQQTPPRQLDGSQIFLKSIQNMAKRLYQQLDTRSKTDSIFIDKKPKNIKNIR